MPAIRQRPGFGGVLILVDPAENKNLALTLWQSEAAMRAADEDETFRALLGHQHFAADEAIKTFAEVALWEPPPESAAADRATAARVASHEVQPNQLEERLRHVQEQMTRAARHRPGWRGYLLLEDRAGDRVLSISLWHTTAERDASMADASFEQLRPDDRFVTGPVTQEQFEVASAELPAAAHSL